MARKHAQRNPTRVEEILAENIAEYYPQTLQMKRACLLLSNIEERLERVKDGTPEHGRLIDKWTMLTEMLVRSRSANAAALDADLATMSDDEQIAEAAAILQSLLQARDERSKAAARVAEATAPAGAPSDAEVAHTSAPAPETKAPEALCEYCHYTLTRCAEVKEKHLDAWRAFHWLDPLEVKRRDDEATDEMYLSLTGRPRPKGGVTW